MLSLSRTSISSKLIIKINNKRKYSKSIDDLKHVTIPIKTGGEVILLDTGAIIDPEAQAMIQALHSRSVGGLKDHLKVLCKRGPKNFMKNFYVGYGHKSIGDCGNITVFIEGISMLAAKAIQDSKLYNGQEASTRYIDFSRQPFIDILNTLNSNELLELQRDFYLELQEPLNKYLKELYPQQDNEKDSIYDKAITARVFDISRGFLPAGASTNLAWSSTLRQFSDRLLFLRNHPLKEVQNIATALEDALIKKYPSSFTKKRYEETEEYQKIIAKYYYYHTFYPSTGPVLMNIDGIIKYRLLLFKDLLNLRSNNKTELPKFLSTIGTVSFKFVLDFASYRDLQRHRAIDQRMPLLTTIHGFHPWYIDNLPPQLQIDVAKYLDQLKNCLNSIPANTYEKQYYIPMGYQVSNHIVGDLPAMIYMLELRSGNDVHPTLKLKAQEMSSMLTQNINVPIYYNKEPDRFNVKRGTQDIILKN